MAGALVDYAPALDAVRGIRWPAQRRVHSTAPGPHASSARGTAAEFIEYRGYRQGDDPRTIDWKLVARTERVYIRLSPVHTRLPTMLVVDGSASMAFPQDSHAKWNLACQLAVGLAEVARHGGDPVGLVVTHADGMKVVAPQTRRTVLDAMMRALDAVPEADPPLASAVDRALRFGGRVVVLSDFLGDADAVLSAAKPAAAAGREIHAVHVVDREELEPDPRKMLVTDPEQPALRRPLSKPARETYLRTFGEWRARLSRDWTNTGAMYCMVVPGSEPLRRTIRRVTSGA